MNTRVFLLCSALALVFALVAPSLLQGAQEAQEREQKCVTYRDRLERFTYSRHLYRENENGEREYLDEEEMQAARDQVQDQIDEYCSS